MGLNPDGMTRRAGFITFMVWREIEMKCGPRLETQRVWFLAKVVGLSALMLFGVGCQGKDGKNADSNSGTAKSAMSAPLPAHALHLQAKLVEIPGAFPANDLYNYAYIMRYEVTQVLGGEYTDKDILVGHYNPRMSRNEIKDDKDSLVNGNVTTFEEGALQDLIVMPMDSVYTGAIEDEFYQDKRPRWFAIQADKL